MLYVKGDNMFIPIGAVWFVAGFVSATALLIILAVANSKEDDKNG